ncbi:zinc finger protein 469 [Hemicordylus capensis]|uniref:zinc finger protein 469 n=1 Tax=Hemicordylus capensis TaxID=884348 RepID=UPI002302D8CA|nr:zinc finger protein 469 [Hemicordylus capensis]
MRPKETSCVEGSGPLVGPSLGSMMGETQHVFATTDTESGTQDKDLRFEQFGKKDVSEFDGGVLDVPEPRPHNGTENGSGFVSVKDKEPHSQREAVIRPQQAGKIDFKSLHNRSKFPSDNPWGAVKGSPQSPTGKSRAREKNRRSGKGERGHQQLYRLTISNARPNPTIGIAYPQQKVTPPKKVDVGRGPVSGSYRFHVPSIPEREVELQQEDLGYARCFPETSSSHISSNYTSPAATACPNHGGKLPAPAAVPLENPGANGQLHYLEFQGNGNSSWPPPDKSLPGANHGLSASKPPPFPESSQASAHCLGPLSFQYPCPALHGSAPDPFQGDGSAQDYVDVPLAAGQASHGAFNFHSSSRDWKEEALGNRSYDNLAPEGRSYGLPPPFLPAQAQGHLPCYKGRDGHPTDHNHGAISPSGAIDPTPSTFQENQALFPHSLHVSSLPKPAGKRQPSSKDKAASPRILDPGSSLRRNMPPISLPPPVHFQNQAYRDAPGSGASPSAEPFEKSLPPTGIQAHPRLLQPWEGGKKPYAPLEPSAAPFPIPVGNQLSFGGHLGPEQRQQLKKTWQHLHLTSAMPGQNRIELSRKLASQKLPFPLGALEWDGSSKAPKSGAGYPSKVLLSGGGAVMQRHDPAPQSSADTFCFEGVKDAEAPSGCGARSKALFFSVSPALPLGSSSRLPPNPALALPPSTLAPSPSDSPLPSPAPNPAGGSTCSSLSPMSSSPTSHGLEDPLTPSPLFHPPCCSKEGGRPFHTPELLSSVHYQAADPAKAFHLSPEAPKEELLYKGVAESHFHKLSMDLPKGCPEGFEAEPPPPPYSSHHLLASSLSSASLDQLDVFLTCKQCDQNFSNLSSFLEHRQFCSSHAALLGQSKDASRGTEFRKQQQQQQQQQQHHPPPDSNKHTPAALGLLQPPDPHLQLLPLNKTVDFLASDGEGKGDAKEDPLRVSQLSSLASNPLPLSASDLEIDDAKLDSLITEALNGLGYQSDNPEIDSSFIDVFADEELSSVKVPNGGVPCKAKENVGSGKKTKHAGAEETVRSGSCCEDRPSAEVAKSRTPGKPPGHRERGASWFLDPGDDRLGKESSSEMARNKVVGPATCDEAPKHNSVPLKVEQKSCRGSFPPAKQAAKATADTKQSARVNCASPPPAGSRLRPAHAPAAAGDTQLSAKDAKKRTLWSGTWSKELIHKIVQQKNQLHKLHGKSNKVVPLALLADRLLPETKDDRFGEYEYISESDDERVARAKRHCRRKLGSRRFGGRLRSSLSRRRPGRGGREKEKEPDWRCSQRRERGEPPRAPCKEPGRKDDGVARVRRRSSRSSTSSCQSTSLSSETSSSPQSTERADSDTEKESGRRRRRRRRKFLAGPKNPREPLNMPEKGVIGRSHQMASGLSREPASAQSAKILSVGLKASQRGSPNVSPLDYTKEEEGVLQTHRRLRHSKVALGKSPAVFLGADDSERGKERPIHASSKPEVTAQELELCALGLNPRWRQLTAYNGESLKCHADELLGPFPVSNLSIPSHENSSSEKAYPEGLKEQKECAPPVGCFHDNPVGLPIAEKRPHALVHTTDTFYDCKELSGSYESPPGLFSGPPATEPPHCDNVYLCHGDPDVGSFREKHPETSPYEANPEQSKVTSPLSFDSSSVFGELPVAEFDASLYDTVTSSKESYIPYACAGHPLGKMIPFEQHYPPFLQEKDWMLMEEVSPVLPDDVAPFHSLSAEKPLAKRFPGEINPLPLPLPERVADYTVPFMNGISDDELEIKRLVTELESQLQTSKLNMEASDEHRTPKHHSSAERKEASGQFSPLTLDQESNGKGLFLMEREFENADFLSAKACICENAENEKTLLPALDGSPGEAWPSPVPFGPLHSSMLTPSAADLILAGPYSSKEAHDKLREDLKDVVISGEDSLQEIREAPERIVPDSCLSDVSDNIEVPSYRDHLIRSPDPLAAELNIHGALPPRADAFPELQQEAKTFDGTAELEPYSHLVPCLKPEFGLQSVGAQQSGGSLGSSTQNIRDPEERPFHKASSPETLENMTPFQMEEDGPALTEKAEKTEGAQTSPKEMDEAVEYAAAPQEKAANPLQQLQLFVARTVRNNEEDLLMPCFPGLHSAPRLPTDAHVQPGQEEPATESLQNGDVANSPMLVERRGSMGEESESIAKASEPATMFLEPEKQAEHLAGKVSLTRDPLVLQGPELHHKVTEQPPLKDGCSGARDINLCADGISLEHGNLSALSNSMVTSLLREEGARGGQAAREVEGEPKEATLAFRNGRKSPLSPSSLEEEMSSHILPAMLGIHGADSASWGEDGGLCVASSRQMVGHGGQVRQPQGHLSLAPTSLPENQPQDDYLLPPTGFCSATRADLARDRGLEKQASHQGDASQDCFALEANAADRERVLEMGVRNRAHSDHGAPQTEEAPCLAAAEGQPVPARVHRCSSEAEKMPAVSPMQSPSESKEWEEPLTSTPALPHCRPVSPPLPSDVIGSVQQHFAGDVASDLAKPQKDVPVQSSSSLCSADPTVALEKEEGPLKLQTNNCHSTGMLPSKKKALSGGLPRSLGHEDSNTRSVKAAVSNSQPASRQDTLLDLAPSGTDSSSLTDAIADQHVELASKPPAGKEAGSCSQKESDDQMQPEIMAKEMPTASLTETADTGGDYVGMGQFLEAAETGPNCPPEGSDNNVVENHEQNEDVVRSFSCRGQGENKGRDRREDSKSGLLRKKKGTLLQVTCDICSVSFRSQTGLMRHKGVKHQKKDSPILLDLDFPPLGKALKANKQVARKNRKVFIKERECRSQASKTAVSQPFPKPHKSQRKESSTEIQEVISRVLSDLSRVPFDITGTLQSTESLSDKTKAKSKSSQAVTLVESRARYRKELAIAGKDGEASTVESGSFAKKKVKGKVRRGKAKVVPKLNKTPRSSRLENKSPEICSQEIPSSANLIPSTVSKERKQSPTSVEKQADVQPPSRPPPLAAKELEERAGGTSPAQGTAGEEPLQDVGRHGELMGKPGPEEETLHTKTVKEVEAGLSITGEEACGGLSEKESESQESPWQEANCGNPDSPFICTPSSKRLQPPCDAVADLKHLPEAPSGKAPDESPCPDSKPWETDGFQPRNGPCSGSVDLQSLFDDDSTFSQLFPRNNQFARRKCTRVYGKRTKKPKPVTEVNARPEGATDPFTVRMASDLGETSSFCVTREDPCEYETISIDDALMLNMCHGNKASGSHANPSPAHHMPLLPDARETEDGVESKRSNAFQFLGPKGQREALPPLSNWGSLEKAENAPTDGTLLSLSVELLNGQSAMEASPEPPDLQEEAYGPRTDDHPASPTFQTIDMEMLNTKLEMQDTHFYSVGGEHLSCADECAFGFKPLSASQSRTGRTKGEEGRQGKPRGDLTLKAKDKQYKCKVCFQWFLTLGELDFHKLTHNPSPPPTCYMCVQRKFSSREQLRDHLKEKHARNKAGLWACGMCLKEISDVWMYNEHLREHATQFARKGQAQKSVLGLPGCFGEEDAAVTHFLNSIMCRKPSKASKPSEAASKVPACKESKSPKEPAGQEAKPGKEPSESPARSQPPASSPKPAPKVEGPQKLVPMHPECKDPSRDCHHCGKQFPKPFKLQRHLVVHSLQKIYLCHKCPLFYQETKELRSHISQEHGAEEEADVKHTTLYACELCADVMHVIKKSFICSTCNYTFSKKEQYDRHMEKHLVGSSRTFRFRGVMRPGVLAKEGDGKVQGELHPRDGVPAAKKKKVAHHNNVLAQDSPMPLGCSPAPQLGGEALLPPSQPLPAMSPSQDAVKAEDLVGEISSLWAEMEKSPFDYLPPPSPQAPEPRHDAASLPLGQLTKGDPLDKIPPPFLGCPDAISIDLAGLAHEQPAVPKLSPPPLSGKHKQAEVPKSIAFSSRAEHATGAWDSPRLQEDAASKMPELSATNVEAAECKGPPKTRGRSSPDRSDTAPRESATRPNVAEDAFHTLPLKDKAASPALHPSAKEVPSRRLTSGPAHSESVHCSLGNTEEVQKPPSLKDKALLEKGASAKDNCTNVGIKETGSNPLKPASGHLRSETVGTPPKHSPSDLSKCQDRPVANGLPKLHPKRRKEHKSSHKGSSASRENIEGDGGKKKKVRMPDAIRSEGAGRFRRAEWSNGEAFALFPRRRDTQCNKLAPKPKVATTGGQLKKMVLDQCFQKKVEIRHPNGDLKRKKDILGSKTLHPLFAKDPPTSLPVPSSLNRHRTVQGAKLPDSHNYRTAESQNNLLSQLFGQKLTSFKIPLRRDTSE